MADDIDKQANSGYNHFFRNASDNNEVISITDPSVLLNGTATPGYFREFSLQLSPPTLFLFFLIGLFFITALLHGMEGFQLIHGIWYMLCLPSGYILLMVYSLANITDRSWGKHLESQKCGLIHFVLF